MNTDKEATVELAEAVLEMSTGGRLAPDDPEKLPTVMLLAHRGWQGAHDALCSYSSQLTKEGYTLPKWLQIYVVETAWKGFAPKKRKFANLKRDSAICLAIRELVDCGYAATRNEATAIESGCSIVSEALARGVTTYLKEALRKSGAGKARGQKMVHPLSTSKTELVPSCPMTCAP